MCGWGKGSLSQGAIPASSAQNRTPFCCCCCFVFGFVLCFLVSVFIVFFLTQELHWEATCHECTEGGRGPDFAPI